MSYFNTTNENPQQVEIFNINNRKQDDLVLDIIKKLKVFSAKDIYNKYPIANTPITSIRRSINTHKRLNVIIETGHKVKGIYDRNELQYKLNK